MKRTSIALFYFLLLIIPAAVQAQFTYTTNADNVTLTITGYSGGGGAVVIPTTNISGMTVTGIGYGAFHDTGLTSITIPDTITSIASVAFSDNLLTNVTIPASVTNIGVTPFYTNTVLTNINVDTNNLFYNSSNGVLFGQSTTALIEYPIGLTGSYVVPGSVTSIGNDAFYACTGLTSLTLDGSLGSIGSNAFSRCANLVSVTLPPSLTNISLDAFSPCVSLTNVCFEGNASTNFSDVAFVGDPLTNIFYVAGTSGWSSNYDNVQVAGIPTTPCVACGVAADAGNGALQVEITPSNVISAGAHWRVDGGADEDSGMIVSSLSIGNHTVSFTPVFGWHTPAAEIITITSNAVVTVTGVYTIGTSGALTVTLLPAAAVADGAQWRLVGPTNQYQDSGVTLSGLAAGEYTIAFSNISGWNTPPDQTNTITSGVTTTVSAIYTPVITPSGVTLLTNGFGAIKHSAFLVTNKTYKVTAVPAPKNVFTGWIGGTTQPFTLLSSLAGYTFTNEPGLVLEANFVTNTFLAAAGAYSGLFAPANTNREQTNSGSFSFNLTSSGSISGSLNLGGQSMPFSGKFGIGGQTNITVKATRTEASLNIALQLDFADQSVSGVVSNSAFTAELNGFRNVFSSAHKATAFDGQYTFVIPGVSEASVGPFGDSYGTVKVSPTGALSMAGSLADGTAISQTSFVSQDGYWPLYIKLYGGNGSLWGWTYFSSNTITAAPSLSWINQTNTSKTAVYRSGFTNQQAAITGDFYLAASHLPGGLKATLEESNSTLITNKLTLKTNAATGVISGSFVNPANAKQTIKVNGVILQGESTAQGYFLETNQSGAFILGPP